MHGGRTFIIHYLSGMEEECKQASEEVNGYYNG